jgi:pimeloyl-ACP methyl ester carboxylesterase
MTTPTASTTMWRPTRRFDSEQGEIAWDVLGDGPEAIVLSHGTPFSSLIWREVAPALAGRWRVYFWDLAGYGGSERFEGQRVSLDAQTRILGQLLAHWGLERPVLVGHDFGGAITLRSVLLDATPTAGLVLVDPVALGPWGTGFFRLAREHHEILMRLPGPVHDGLLAGYMGWASARGLPRDLIDALTEPWRGPQGQAAFYRQIVQNDVRFTDEVEPHLGRIDVPTLIVWGADDAWLPVGQAHDLHRRIPASVLRIVPGAGHLMPLDAPDVLIDAMRTFLADA